MLLLELLKDLWCCFKYLLWFLLAWAVITGIAFVVLYYTGNLEPLS